MVSKKLRKLQGDKAPIADKTFDWEAADLLFSALSMSDPVKAKTELRPLLGTRDFFKIIVVSKSSMKPWTDEDGIVHLGLYDFLLNEDLINM